MARYLNTRTGAIIDSPCTISGGDWQPVEVLKIKEEKEVGKEEVTREEAITSDDQNNEPDIEGLTKKEIMQELDAFGIKYNPRATKKELYDLMMEGK